MTHVKLVDFKKQRHKTRAKSLLTDVTDCIADLKYEVAGYAIVVWNDAGAASSAFHSGGPIHKGGLTSYVTQKLDIRPNQTDG